MDQSELERRAAGGNWLAYRALHTKKRPTGDEDSRQTAHLVHAVDSLLVLRAREVKRLEGRRRAEAREIERQRLLAKAQKLIEQAYQLAKQQEKDGDF